MRKIFFIVLITLMMTALAVSPAAAKPKVIQGKVTQIDQANRMITISTARGQDVDLLVPASFDLAALTVGDRILARGLTMEDGAVRAAQLRVLPAQAEEPEQPEAEDDPGEAENPDEEEQAADKAFCNPDIKQEPQPAAARLAASFGVDVEWVMQHYCEGSGIGEIMLALRTAELTGVDGADQLTQKADELLGKRAEGLGWGKIWQELKLVGSEKAHKIPPGSLKKPNKGNNH